MEPLTLFALLLLGGGVAARAMTGTTAKGKRMPAQKLKTGEWIPGDLPYVEKPPKVPTMEDVRKALRAVAGQFGQETAEWVERIWRKETNHFRSGFAKTCGAGMHPWTGSYPWLWGDARRLWDTMPGFRPIGWTYMVEGGTKYKRAYLVFENPTDFAMTLATIITARAQQYGSLKMGAGSWYSKTPSAMASYANAAEKIIPKITRGKA